MFYIETEMFRFSPDVSIPKQECSDLVQMILNRNKKHSDLVQTFLIETKTFCFGPDLCTWQCACSCMDMYIHENVTYFILVHVHFDVHFHVIVCTCRCT